jgi:TonB family protein
MPIDSKVMAARRIRYVAPVYPDMARVARTEGDVVLHANIGTDGTVVGLQTISGNPLLVRAALEAAMKWQYEPMVINSRAVQVDTTLVIRFVLSEDQQTTSNAQTVPNQTGVIIRLRNGGTIHADTAHKIHGRVEYTIGEGTYRINESSVTEILEGKDALAAAVSSATPSKSATSFDAPANKVTATPLKAMPKIPAEDPANWELYQSTEVLREECRSGEISRRVHPEFQSTSNFPVSQEEANRECLAINVEMESDYEQMVDRGTELERKMCRISSFRPLYGNYLGVKFDPQDEQELGRILAEFHRRMDHDIKSGSRDRGSGVRLLLDFYRLDGSCGHGMG